MKRVLVGGFISLIGSIWTLAIMLLAVTNLAGDWREPLGRLLTTIDNFYMMPWFIISVAFVLLGVVLMLVEYFRKDN